MEEAVAAQASNGQAVIGATRRTLDNAQDETGIEAALSEVSIERILDNPIELYEHSRLGLDFGFLLRKELTRSGLAGPFRVIASAHPAGPSLNVGDTCAFRFHRQSEGQVRLEDDLDSYKSEAIAVLDF